MFVYNEDHTITVKADGEFKTYYAITFDLYRYIMTGEVNDDAEECHECRFLSNWDRIMK